MMELTVMPEEIQIDTKLFKSWRKKNQRAYEYIGPTYTNSFAEESERGA
jgi:hypothetical protein